LEVIRHFLLAWDFPTGSEIFGENGEVGKWVFGENDPQKVKISKKALP